MGLIGPVMWAVLKPSADQRMASPWSLLASIIVEHLRCQVVSIKGGKPVGILLATLLWCGCAQHAEQNVGHHQLGGTNIHRCMWCHVVPFRARSRKQTAGSDPVIHLLSTHSWYTYTYWYVVI